MPSVPDESSIRCLDLVVSVPGLIVLSPLLLLLAAAVRATSKGPALFRSTRVGRYGRPFTLYKFRSMAVGGSTHGPAITAAGDPRVTSLGRVLRRFKLDELPQLLNVVAGDMSLVGPRPEDPRYVRLYSREELRVLDARPGITSPASLSFRKEESLLSGPDWEACYKSEILPTKLAIDGEYIAHRTVWSDGRIILHTIASLLPLSDTGPQTTGER